jgi:CDP-glucose 4,6-dehydratase
MPGDKSVTLRDELVNAYKGKTVLVTGHTGFKGSWLSEWLLLLGARVVGIALPPPTDPALFDQLRLAERMEHHLQDIRDDAALTRLVLKIRPDYVFHLAAQPLVRASYDAPVETYSTNVMGTVHLLGALQQLQMHYRSDGQQVCAAVMITTDKCYANREWLYGYREEDPLGGYDPYSSSKACAELAIASFRQSFFNPLQSATLLKVGVASARAGNVIGGGDWALDRIVPDCIRDLQRKAAIAVRNPAATRPWQHVLEPLCGYLQLGMRQRGALITQDRDALESYCSAYNFGPALTSNRPVEILVREVLKHWPGRWDNQAEAHALHEAGKLNLAWDKAFHLLNWQPIWMFDETIARTVRWYRQQSELKVDAQTLTATDIEAYERQAAHIVRA